MPELVGEVKGVVTPGFGAASKRMKTKLANGNYDDWDFVPVLGTLNLHASRETLQKILDSDATRVKDKNGWTYYKAYLEGLPCVIKVFESDRHFELLSRFHLRTTLNLKDGDVLTVILAKEEGHDLEELDYGPARGRTEGTNEPGRGERRQPAAGAR